ncbi:hypothetical protein Pst134EA_009826 [Puccinia striiformis f. sp. tritici]|nr:hypothetical protein Pst134EA_009826 [Puccinia striiformis f. sp. tritici]KAH9458643.1 hypothetical protein Pst134EB_010941 [Puccinia striiformis f. sp. tritici]KAH9469305.1 hypothetical protein Pst134EA_009826 [Puccinia striiformis f. sp. tritici]KNE95218.1 hypothetical protein PSTG_11482 [Puccinia striiformis f. sp. tritici PST-78]
MLARPEDLEDKPTLPQGINKIFDCPPPRPNGFCGYEPDHTRWNTPPGGISILNKLVNATEVKDRSFDCTNKASEKLLCCTTKSLKYTSGPDDDGYYDIQAKDVTSSCDDEQVHEKRAAH